MDRFRALLLGVADYQMYGLPPLPFVPDDIAGLATALEDAGYTVESADSGALSRGTILTRVARFLGSARRGDTLLIYLSGHGAHTGGHDYLVPSDADSAFTPIADVLVPITYWAAKIDDCAAAQVVFFVDACREGVRDDTMGLTGNLQWSTGKIARANRRNVAYVFACGPGQLSRFVTTGTETFSIFSRALQQAIADGMSGQTLGDLVRTIDALTAEMTEQRGLPGQEIQAWDKGRPGAEFQLLPVGMRQSGDGAGGWMDQAGDHQAWLLVPDDHVRERVRAATVALVRHLWRLRRQAGARVAEDPWQDQQFGSRMAQRVEFLLARIRGAAPTDPGQGLRLSAAEAALLAAGPYLHDTFWAVQASENAAVNPADWSDHDDTELRGDFRRFVRGYPRLSRRVAAQVHDPLVGGQVGWWLLHRWVRRRLPLQRPEALAAFLVPAVMDEVLPAQVFDPGRLVELLRCIREGPGFLTRGDQPDSLASTRPVATGTAWEQHVRERLVGYLLSVGRVMAIEANQLPEVLVEHMGVADPVSPFDIHATIRAAEWVPRNAARVLRAACPHPAVEIALRAHVEVLDSLLTEVQDTASSDASVALLAALPSHASADQVGPAVTSTGHAAYQSAGVRFHLAEDRVRELLMGEQLYGDAGIAIRELYQNALDACRYRRARKVYLERTGHPTTGWEGQITFAQGTDDNGRAYLECADNGIGMGERELNAVFSRAGTRFVDMAEFLEEQAKWERLDPPVRLFPNSRFGIGVLSYFMLADEISIETRRFDRDGRAGKALRVSIAGPGNLFRIQPGAEPSNPGTVVRLYLRPDAKAPSCVDMLRGTLWVADFHTRAIHSDDNHEWFPRRLSTAAPLGTDDALSDPYAKPIPATATPVSPAPGCPVWWCDAEGAVLVDGIWLGKAPFGAVVDLREERTPRLSVNRTRILDDPTPDVEDLLRSALPGIAAPGNPVLRYAWLCRVAEHRPALADLILDAAIEAGWRSWPEERTTEGLLVAGCFPPDQATGVLPPSQWPAGPSEHRATSTTYRHSFVDRFTADSFRPLAAWRLAAWTAAGAYPTETPVDPARVLRARPTDAVLLSRDLSGHAAWPWDDTSRSVAWLDPRRTVDAGHLVAAAAELSWTVGRAAERLRELGYAVPDPTQPETPMVKTDRTLITYGPYGGWMRHNSTEQIPVGHIIAAAGKLGWTPRLAAERLRELGYPVTNRALPPDSSVVDIDRLLASRNLDGKAPWLKADHPVSLGRIAVAIAATGWDMRRIVKRLREWGFAVPDEAWPEVSLVDTDRALISRHFDGKTWLDPDAPISLGHLVGAAATLGWAPRRVVGRLRELGLPVPDGTVPDTSITEADRTLVSSNLNGRWLWLDATRPVTASHLVAAAVELEWSIQQTAKRLHELGYPVPDRDLPDTPITDADRTLVRRAVRHRLPFFGGVVPLGYVIDAAVELGWTVRRVAGRLQDFDFVVPDGDLPRGLITEIDRRLISRGHDGRPPWLDRGSPVPTGHLLGASLKLGWELVDTAERIRELGFVVSDRELPATALTENDGLLISRNLDKLGPWLDPDQPVPVSQVFAAAVRLGWDRTRVADRLRELGYTVSDLLSAQGGPGFVAPELR